MPGLVMLLSPGQGDLRQFLCRSHPVMAAVTSPASCRAAAGHPARALGQLELQLCLAGDTAHPRVGWWDTGMGVSFHLQSPFQGCCWVNILLPSSGMGTSQCVVVGQEFWNSQR